MVNKLTTPLVRRGNVIDFTLFAFRKPRNKLSSVLYLSHTCVKLNVRLKLIYESTNNFNNGTQITV